MNLNAKSGAFDIWSQSKMGVSYEILILGLPIKKGVGFFYSEVEIPSDTLPMLKSWSLNDLDIIIEYLLNF